MKTHKYHNLCSFYEGIAGVHKKTKNGSGFGYINTLGEEIIECKLITGTTFSPYGYAKVVDAETNLCIIDRQGNIVFKYPHWEVVSDAFDMSEDMRDVFDLVRIFSHTHIIAHKSDNPFGDDWRLIDTKDGNRDLGVLSIGAIGNSNNGIISVMDFADRWGAVNESGKWVIPAKYDRLDILPYSDSVVLPDYFSAAVNGNHRLISRSGETALDFVYDDVSYVTDQCIVIKTGGKYGIITLAGETIIPCKYEGIKVNVSENTISVKSRGLWGWTDMNGNMLVKPSFYTGKKRPPVFRDGLACVYNRNNSKNEGQVGFVNKYGEMAIPYKFNHPVADFSEGMAAFFKKSNIKKKGWINTAGDIVIPPIYTTEEMYFREGCIPVSYNKEWFYIDRNGTRCLF